MPVGVYTHIMNRLFAVSTFALLFLIIEGCATTVSNTQSPSTTPETATAAASTQIADDTETQYGTFRTDTLYSLLVAEMSASRQDFQTTLKNYVDQAHKTQDLAIIARAARIAQFFRAQEESLDMGLLWLEQAPNNLEAVTLVANAYLELGKPLVALDYAEQLLAAFEEVRSKESKQASDEETSQSGGAFTQTIANFSKKADPDTLNILIQRYEQLAITYPYLSGIKVGLSILYQTQGSLDEAMLWADRALEQTPNSTSAIIQQIILLQDTQQTELAINKLETQLENDPSNNRLRLLYARLLSQTDVDKAYEQFTQLSTQSPRQLDLKFSRAILAVELEKMDIAKPLLLELQADNYDPNSIAFYLGHIEEWSENLEAALSHYLSVQGGDNFLAAQHRAGRVLITLGEIARAQSLFAQLRLTYPDREERLYETESSLLVQHKADEQALPLLNRAIKKYPDNFNLRYERSTVYERQKQIALMESDLRHVLNIDPDNVYALNGLGYFLSISTDRYEEAYELIKKALALNPSDAAIIDSMGWVVFKLGRIDEAIEYLQKAFSLFPDPEVAAHLGEALWTKGEKEKAKAILKDNLEDNPEAPEILETLQRLNISL